MRLLKALDMTIGSTKRICEGCDVFFDGKAGDAYCRRCVVWALILLMGIGFATVVGSMLFVYWLAVS